ncbi:Fe-S cluster biogenesis protein NfuA [Variovorax sp. GrIS 2.14]|uniref:NifU family protein n=1 Tax=Variovorax sp. GrIS 2.14 TaxID=3071709 RepID=UPI0038F70A09
MPKIAEIDDTPNPNAVKFTLREPLTWGVSHSYENAGQVSGDALASALFAIPHVSNVFYVDRWLTVTQDGGADWPELVRLIAVPLRAAPAAAAQSAAAVFAARVSIDDMSEEDQERLEVISELLDERIRPSLQADGGDLHLVGLSGNHLSIHYQGACGSCPSSISGTLAAIQNLVCTIEPDLAVVAV